jgi:hypothetical protein
VSKVFEVETLVADLVTHEALGGLAKRVAAEEDLSSAFGVSWLLPATNSRFLHYATLRSE